MRNVSRLALIAGLAVFSLLGPGVGLAEDATVSEGKPAPELKVTGWKNTKDWKLADQKGKVVVLKFWAVWCTTCKASLPKFGKLAEQYKDKAVFVGIHVQRDGDKMPAFVERNKMKFPVCLDPEDATWKEYGKKELPFNILIDKKGVVRKLDAEITDKEIDKLLAE